MSNTTTKRSPKTNSHRPKTASRRVIQRGLIAQISTALFQPVAFYETLPPMRQTRQWLWIGLLILGLVGISAVQQTTTTTTAPPDTGAPINPDPFSRDMSGPGLGFDSGFDFGEIPLPSDPNAPTPSQGGQTADTWTVALVAASHIVLIWGIQAFMLMVVPMFKGNAPQFGDNLQVAIYASLPLAIMAVLQVIFITAGGQLGKTGLSGLLDELPLYTQTTDPFLRSVMLSIASHTTLFMLWSLMMVYWGGRIFLKGHRLVVILVVIAWTMVLVITPVVTEAIRADVPSSTTDVNIDMPFPPEMPPLDMDMDGQMPPFGDMPFDEMPTDEMPLDDEMSIDEMPTDDDMPIDSDMETATEASP